MEKEKAPQKAGQRESVSDLKKGEPLERRLS